MNSNHKWLLKQNAKDRRGLYRGENSPNWKGGYCGSEKTVEQIREELGQRQGNVCAICGKPETVKRKGTTKRLSIDHNHKTGEIRGLLCSRCNMKLGVLENVEFVEKANLYLKGSYKSSWWNVKVS